MLTVKGYLKEGAISEHFMFNERTGKATHCLSQASDAPVDAENDIIACIEHSRSQIVPDQAGTVGSMLGTEADKESGVSQ